jgi:hypothetical protein
MKKFLYIISAIIVLFTFATLISISPQYIEEEQVFLQPDININQINYTTSSEQPRQAILKLASFESEENEGVELTIYNQNFALVKDIRKIFLEQGLNLVEYKNVASQIDPTSVMFKDLENKNNFVVEQNYEYDLISKQKLLEKYLDKEIKVTYTENNESVEYSGILLNYSNELIIDTGSGIVILSPDKIILPELPKNLRTKPTLVWKLYSESKGERLTETSYLTNGINWNAEYIARINENDTRMDFAGWVSIDNKSGTPYNNTSLKLVAGDVHRVSTQPQYSYEMLYGIVDRAYSPEQFTQESLFEYHMYTLDRKTDVLNNQKKQISLLSSENVPVKKILYYDGARQGTKVQVKLEFKNSEEQGLGIPLPRGTVRVYKEDSQGKLQFVGEDIIDHTPRNEERTLFLGNVFDIVGERKQTENKNISKGVYRTSYEITLRNQKDNAEEIVVREYVGRSWEVIQKSQNFEKKSSSEIEFKINVPANSERTITYTIEHIYHW